MSEDKLSRAQRVRLEAFAQAGQRYAMRGCPIEQHLKEAVMIEEFLWAADKYHDLRQEKP